MVERKREIYIKVEGIEEITSLFDEIKHLEEETRNLFKHYDRVSSKENEIIDNWNNYLEDILQKLEHVTL